MKKQKDQQSYFRVADFENAIRKSDLNIRISTINYLPDSFYVKEITGFVEQDNRNIRVTWNCFGEAAVAGEPTPEFNLKLQRNE